MRVKASLYIFLLPLYFLMCFNTSGQSHKTRKHYTGDYENPYSWDPFWAVPSSNLRDHITIHGNIKRNGDLFVSGSGKLTIKDTLIIYGDLYLGEENELHIENNGVLIVFGNLHLGEEADVKADGYFIVTENIILEDDDDGKFKSNDDPVKVFIGGSIPSDLTDNNSDYSALNCSNPPTIPYTNSTCSYGNILDLLEDPIYSFYKTLCPAILPAIITVNGPTSFCDGGNVILTANTGMAYLWSNGAESKSIEVLSSGSFTVRTINSLGCQSAVSDPEDVLVHPLPPKPTITHSGPLNFCEGESVTLTAEEASSYSWSNGATSKSIIVSNQGVFKVKVTNEFGCLSQESDAINTTVLPLPAKPTISFSGSTSFCEGGTVKLSSSPGTSWLWSNGAVTKDIDVSVSGVYTVKVGNVHGCLSTASEPVETPVNPLPAKPVIVAEGPIVFCDGSNVTLTSPTAISYEWSNGATSKSILVNNQGAYKLKVRNEFGCLSQESDVINTTVLPLPAKPTISLSESTSFCEGDSIKLSSSPGASWSWSNGAVTEDIFVSTNGVYTVKVSNTQGCISPESEPVEIHVKPLPSKPTIEADGSTNFCDGDMVKLTSTSATSYEWTNGQKTKSINVTKDGLYSVKVTDNNGCTSTLSDTLQVLVNPNPVAVITANGPLSFCEGEKRTLIADGGNSYLWSNGMTGKIMEVSQEGIYSVRVTNQWGCSNHAEAEIIVWQNPSSFAGPDQALNFVFETRLNAELSPGETGEWKVITSGSHVANIYSPSSHVDGLSIGENKFLWKVSNGNCYDESEIIVHVEDMFLPNVITPNNDGKNDYFIIENIPAHTELIIFDRFGKLRFSESNYSNNWNGISNKRIALQEDTYFYVLKFSNGMTKKGYILLKK